mmetsp:Transcript_28931/g.72105  ORF Transcript_28931/g.72105 Transcript_28931/m.72105 type:complete len:239 (+) Transcript_28931:122-838(+)
MSRASLTSLSLLVSMWARIPPLAAKSSASCRSRRVPTMLPLMFSPLRTVLKMGVGKVPGGSAMTTAVPPGRRYSMACENTLGEAATSRAPSAPSPWVSSSTLAGTSLTCIKSMVSSQPRSLSSFIFSSPPSMPMTLKAMVLAYCTATWPSPPPAPAMTTVWKGFTLVSLSPRYTVTPAHMMGTASMSLSLAGILATKSPLATTNSAKHPLTEKPACCCPLAHRFSFPPRQSRQAMQVL